MRSNGTYANIKPYTAGFDMGNSNVFGINFCPEINSSQMMAWIRQGDLPTLNFIELPYAYWGRIDVIMDSQPELLRGTATNDLTQKTLQANGLIMSDVINWDASSAAYRYNHGYRGWAFAQSLPTGPVALFDPGPTPLIRGVNEAYGDGHVQWKDKNKFRNLQGMASPQSYRYGALEAGDGDTDYY